MRADRPVLAAVVGVLVGAVLTFLAAAPLPFWNVWFIGGGEAVGSRGTLWRAMEVGSWSWSRVPTGVALEYQTENGLIALALLIVGGVAGAVIAVTIDAGRAARRG